MLQRSCYIDIHVAPYAAKNMVIGWKEGKLHVKIRGVPEKGKVNNEVLSFLSELFDIPKASLALVSGGASRWKRIEVTGLTQQKWHALFPSVPFPVKEA